MSQAIALMPSLNNYGSTDDDAAETFITSGLAKVLKINNICGYGTDGSSLHDCGLSSQIITFTGVKSALPTSVGMLNNAVPGTIPGTTIVVRNTKAAAFETANGESILAFYNPNCTAANVIVGAYNDYLDKDGFYIKQQVCANFVYDLNGKKGPNTVGKDIGIMSVIYSTDSNVVMPVGPRKVSGSKTQQLALQECTNLDTGEYRLPNIEEALSLYYNRLVLGDDIFPSSNIWTASVVDGSNAYVMGHSRGMKYSYDKNETKSIICVKR